ncbi:symporter [Aureococcus anophagefferens]|nr:symporter [Aureococcus anophagefferens]
MERLLALVLVLRGAVALDCSTPPLSAYPYCDRALPIRARVADLAARFTVNETISQMGTMAAAVPRLGLPALNYGGEALHGVWSTCAAGRCPTQFPAPHAMGASFDRDLWRAVGAASGLEARALFRWNQRHNASDCARSLEGCLGLTFYAPNVNLARDPRWGRIEEVPSEDPLLNGVYGAEFVRGFQGDGAYRVANAVVKHFAVYNLEVDVEDTPPADCYNAVNGEPACTDGALLRRARGALNFTGVLATDCGALEDAVARHKRYATEAEAAAAAIAAGVDSNCGKVLTSALPEALAAGRRLPRFAGAVGRPAKDKAALLLAGYGGEFGGVAVADALLGAYNPGGALTATMLPDAGLPPFRDMAMRPAPRRRAAYRFLDERRVAPLWRFGFGLSYTAFAVSLAGPTRVPRRAATRFSVVVRNVGAVSGDVVVACFVAAVGRPDAPLRELFDFARVRDLAPAASTKVSMELRPRSLSLVDEAGVRSTTAGAYDVRCSAGRVADTEDIRLTVD